MFKIYFSLIWLAFLTVQGISQEDSGKKYDPVTISNTESRVIQSKIVNQQYNLYIHLPAGYDDSEVKYPVLYLLDAQWDFTLLDAIYGQQYFDGFIPAMVIVGITWGGKYANPDSLRARDFTPSNEKDQPQSGGADRFLQFIKNELIPFIDGEYRVSDDRILAGSSLGGLFTYYVLFSDPGIFKYYIPTSPATNWDNGYIYTLAEDFGNKSLNKNLRLYTAVGELEALHDEYNKMTGFLKEKRFPGLVFNSGVVKHSGHSGVKAEGVTRGMQFIFKKPVIVPTQETLLKYTGTYKQKDGEEELNISVNGNTLVLNLTGGSTPLSAQTNTKFYHSGEFLEFEFQVSGKEVTAARETFNGETKFIKINVKK